MSKLSSQTKKPDHQIGCPAQFCIPWQPSHLLSRPVGFPPLPHGKFGFSWTYLCSIQIKITKHQRIRQLPSVIMIEHFAKNGPVAQKKGHRGEFPDIL